MVVVISNYQKEFDQPKNVLINIQNINDNESFKWCFFLCRSKS